MIMKNDLTTKFWIITSSIIAISLTRFLPHPPNFTALGAMALFGGAIYTDNWKRFLIPILALFLSDLVLNNVFLSQWYEGFVWVTPGAGYLYGAMVATIALGQFMIKELKTTNIALAAVISSVLFFLVTNFGVWAGGAMYPKTGAGLIMAYEAGLPFLLNTLAGNILFSAVLFGGYAFAQNRATAAH
tara:strand:+ start:271 stop:831 length:561 start_codon:yes stop_codon:yes gene_type:complete